MTDARNELKSRMLSKGLKQMLNAVKPICVPANTQIPTAVPIKMGTIIIRPVLRNKNGATKLLDVPFTLSNTNYRVFKASRYSGNPICYYTRKWIATKPSISKSFVCFCATEIPDNWIGFKVIGMAKNKRSCFVEPIAGSIEDLLKYYSFDDGVIKPNVEALKVMQTNEGGVKINDSIVNVEKVPVQTKALCKLVEVG